MKGKLLRIARSYMMELFDEMNNHVFDMVVFDEYERNHVVYDYDVDITGSGVDGYLTVYVDGEREFECCANIAR